MQLWEHPATRMFWHAKGTFEYPHDCWLIHFDTPIVDDCIMNIHHVWYIYANIWGILMVNVTIYSIHGSYGSWISTWWLNHHVIYPSFPDIPCFKGHQVHQLHSLPGLLVLGCKRKTDSRSLCNPKRIETSNPTEIVVFSIPFLFIYVCFCCFSGLLYMCLLDTRTSIL